MAEGSQNRRMAASRGRQIEVSGDIQTRPAFKRHLLDSVAGTLDDAGHTRIERILLERSAEYLPDGVDHRFLPIRDLLARGNCTNHLLASIACLVGNADQV